MTPTLACLFQVTLENAGMTSSLPAPVHSLVNLSTMTSSQTEAEANGVARPKMEQAQSTTNVSWSNGDKRYKMVHENLLAFDLV